MDASTTSEEAPQTLRYASTIVAAYLGKNRLAASDLPTVIRSVHAALASLALQTPPDAGAQKPAVLIKKSVMPDYIVCLEDGKKLTMLKRYIRTRYGLSPHQYRVKWNLSPDYPMVAPNYSSRRSVFAKKIGLGQRAPKITAPARKKR